MDSFFLEDDPDAKLSQRQRKRFRNAQLAYKSKRDAKSENSDSQENEHDNDDFDLTRHSEEESEESDHETAEQKRLRLAKSYLEKVKEDVYDINEGEIDAKEIDKQLISERIRGDVLENQGKLFRVIADEYASLQFSENDVKVFKCGKAGPQLSLTCATFVSSGSNADGSSPKPFVYAGSKDATIIKWDFVTGKRINVIKGGLKPTKKLLKSIGSRAIECIGHNDHILTMDASFDGKFIVSFDSSLMFF